MKPSPAFLIASGIVALVGWLTHEYDEQALHRQRAAEQAQWLPDCADPAFVGKDDDGWLHWELRCPEALYRISKMERARGDAIAALEALHRAEGDDLAPHRQSTCCRAIGQTVRSRRERVEAMLREGAGR